MKKAYETPAMTMTQIDCANQILGASKTTIGGSTDGNGFMLGTREQMPDDWYDLILDDEEEEENNE